MTRWAIDIDRADIATAALVEETGRDLAPGEIDCAIDLVALTANNVTYAALGQRTPLLGLDAGYWDFFGDRDRPGRLPTWGFATVTASTVPAIAVGERFYGYWPLASHVVLRPAQVSAGGFVDAAPRRAALPATYNRYARVEQLADHREADHDWWPIYRPLFMTGWLIADQFEDEGDYRAATVIVSGASSKTAIGFAHAIKARGASPRLVGLASARSAAFTRATGLYDEVVGYDSIDAIAADGGVALVDFAGDPVASRAVHERFGDALTIDLIVGITHWDAPRERGAMPGPRPTAFFAPGRLEKRAADWGAAGFRTRAESAWLGFMDRARTLTAIDRRRGGPAALAAWRDAVAGRVDPRAGVLIVP